MATSTLTKKQVKIFGPKLTDIKTFDGDGFATIKVKVRYDDRCGNGHNTFSITADIFDHNGKWRSSGCQHDKVVKYFPELAKYIKWHLCSSDGPLHYIANTVFFAGDKDHNGRKKGDISICKYYIANDWGLLCDYPEGSNEGNNYRASPSAKAFDKKEEAEERAKELGGQVVIWVNKYSNGKERELDLARKSAIWPDATDEELIAPGLEEKLKARLPKLMEEFKADMEELGFTW